MIVYNIASAVRTNLIYLVLQNNDEINISVTAGGR